MKRILPFVFLLMAACAKQTMPGGGPKDEKAPELVSSIPANQSVNFKGSKLELVFNEWIFLKNPKEQIIITPRVSENYKVTSKKNKLTLEFEEPWQDSTTYTINFRDAVQDNTDEKNTAANLSFAFSSGPYIDSLKIEGTIIELLKNKPVEEATVALVQAADTFDIYKHKPEWLTRTDKSGNYTIENLKPGTYLLYAFTDKNRNSVVDSKSEQHGFISEPIQLDSSLSGINIELFNLDTRPLKLVSSKPFGTFYNIRFSKSLDNYSVTGINEQNLTHCYGEDASQVRIYNTLQLKDSLAFSISALDSVGNKIDTLLYLKFNPDGKKENFTASIQNTQLNHSTNTFEASIKLNKPISTLGYDSLFIKLDSAIQIPIQQESVSIDTKTSILKINQLINPALLAPKPERKTTFKKDFVLGVGSVISIESDTAKRATVQPRKIDRESTAILTVDVDCGQPFIVQVLDKQFKEIKRVASTKKIIFDFLPAGEYLIALTIDANNNGRWDPGLFTSRTQPEKLIFYKNEKGQPTVTLKANWEVDGFLIRCE
ncbi:MAG: Ig-like domain-containing protein [Flammeovirgaceae bacterium]|nr:Ig-like domain-containing protein [Flammeovirgaceae bacterium]